MVFIKLPRAVVYVGIFMRQDVLINRLDIVFPFLVKGKSITETWRYIKNSKTFLYQQKT